MDKIALTSRAKLLDGLWTVTNATEHHLRVDGRIVGKIRRGFDWQTQQQWPQWQCQIHTPRLRAVGSHSTVKGARSFVERSVLEHRRMREVQRRGGRA